ncbi:MAG: methyltransferase domain-containing protein [Thermoleophilia bacterium]|nr:methyltransferase domain-containing protein [Thermoleophilia bacterium]
MRAEPDTGAAGDPVAWHDAENGGFAADLGLFARLAGERPGGVLDLGAGSGRVALRLAEAGHPVTAVDRDAGLLAALERRARERGLDVVTEHADARSLELDRSFPLILAPMQLLHIVGGASGRRRVLAAAARHLRRGGRFWAVVIEEPLPLGSGRPDPIPDVREVRGWVHSSLPVEVAIEPGSITMVRMRRLVAPDGTMTESRHVIRMDRFSLGELDRDADAAGLAIVGCERLPRTVEHEDSVAVALEARDG